MKRFSSGFSLVELLVTISIIGILSSVLFINFNEGSEQSRDAQRKSDLQNLQNAIELYKNKNGMYPEGCNGPGVWSGQSNSVSYMCSPASDQYIKDLAPEFIPSLPIDPKLNGNDSGYVYTVNGERTVYKIMAKNTVESEVITYGNKFKSCEVTNNSTGMCDATHAAGNSKPNHCQAGNSTFQTSYAVWGGFANPNGAFMLSDDVKVERNTEAIICDIP